MSKKSISVKTGGFWNTFFKWGIFAVGLFTLAWVLLLHLRSAGSKFWWVGVLMGIVVGLLFGFAMTLIARPVTLSMSFQDKGIFKSVVYAMLTGIGYCLQSETKNFIIYKPSIRAGLLMEKIIVQMENNSATIIGPLIHVKKLQKLLRIRGIIKINPETLCK
jgi:hypothetical protein